MRLIGLFFFLLTGLASLAIAALFVLPLFIDWQRFLPQISEEISERIGREITITGEVEFVIFPAPALSVDEVSIANHPQGYDATMLTLQGLDARLALAPLLSGNVRITELHLRSPVLTLEQFEDGGNNWEGLQWAEEDVSDTLDNIQIGSLTLEEGVFRQLNHRTGRARILGGIEGEIKADSLFGAFSAEGNVIYAGQQYSVRISSGRFDGERATPFKIKLTRAEGAFALNFSGLAGPPQPTRDISGRLMLETEDVFGLLLSSREESGLPVLPLKAEAGLVLNGRRTELHDIKTELGENKINGGVEMVYAEPYPELTITLTGDVVDLGQVAGEQNLYASWQELNGLIEPAAKRWGLSLPENSMIILKGEFAALNWQEDRLRDISFSMQTSGGEVMAAELTANLPGSTKFALTTERASANGDAPPMLAGRLVLEALAPEQFLRWLTQGQSQAYTAALDVSLFSKWESETRFRLTEQGGVLLLDDIKAQLAGNPMRAQGRYTPEANHLVLALELERFDIDRHGEALRLLAMPFLTGTASEAGEGEDEDAPPAFTLESSVKLTGLFVDGGEIGTAQGTIGWQKEVIALEDWQFTSRYEGEGKFGAKMDFSGEKPKGQINASLSLKSPADLLAAISNISLTARQNEALDNSSLVLNIILPGGEEKAGLARIAANGVADDTKFMLNAEIAPWHDVAHSWLDAQFEATNPNAIQFLHQTGLPLSLAAKGKGRAALTLSGPLSETMEAKADIQLGGAHYLYEGVVRHEEGVRFAGAGKLALEAPNFSLLTYSLGLALSKPESNPPFKLRGDIEKRQTAWHWRNLVLTIAGEEIASQGVFDRRAQNKAFLEAELRGKMLNAGWFFPPSKDSWSTAFLPGTANRGLEGFIKLAAEQMVMGRFRFRNFRTQLELADGGWRAQTMRAGFAGGALTGTFELSSRPRYAFSAGMSLAGANVETLTQMLWGHERLSSGKLDISGTFSAKGRSLLAIISSLEGEGQADWHSPILYGFNMTQLDEAVANAQNPDQVSMVLERALNGGETRLASFATRFSAKNGLIEIPLASFSGEGARGKFGAFIDLPRALIDAEWRFLLPNNKDLPDFNVLISGALGAPKARADSFELEQGFSARLIEKGIEQVQTGGELPDALKEYLGLE